MLIPTNSRRGRALIKLFTATFFLSCLAFLFVGCSPKKIAAAHYDLKGKVVAVDRAREEVTIDHEAIPGFMEAMVMPFTLRDREALKVVEPGDQIQATLALGTDGSAWLENPIITKGAPGGDAATANLPGPRAGDEVPDFSLVNQDGKRIRFRDYQGRAVLLTFIYTRCPLPDYCPLMSTKFAELHRELRRIESEPRLRHRTHLLSITVDPAYDTPKVLKSYGAGYTEEYSNEKFDRWEFLTGSAEEVKKVAEFFGLEYYPEKDQIIHSLRTAIIAPDGRVHKIYRGNDWRPSEILRELDSLSTSAS